MSENKFLKGHCRKHDRYYGIDIKQIGSTWKVVNMVELSRDEGRILSSCEIEQPYFETNTTLIACQNCGNRKVGGCACAKSKPCSPNMKYRFDCIYCNEFYIDYSLPTEEEVAGRGGETMKISQNQEVVIRYADNRPLKTIEVGVGWDPAVGSTNMDVDSSVVLLSPDSSQYDLVCFYAKEHPSGAVIHHGDNLTGGDGYTSGEDDENITVALDRVPANRDRLVFVLNIYQAAARGQSLDKVRNLYIKLYDPDSHKALIEYHVDNNMMGHNSIVIGVASRKGSGWTFKAIGSSLNTDDVADLASKCKSMRF